MSSTYTTNKNLAEPALGDTGWNSPLNSNFTIIDNCLGSRASVSLSSSNVTLSTAQIQSAIISFTGTLLTNVNVVFPAGVGGIWAISNFCYGGASNYYITLTTGGSGAIVSLQGRYGLFNVYSDGTNLALIDNTVPSGMIQAFGGQLAPSGWLACDGTSYSSAAYPALFFSIGYTWGGSGAAFNVPDLRGTFLRGTGTNTTGASSGATGPAIGTYNADTYLNHNHTITDPGHAHYSLGGGGLVSVGSTTGTTFTYGSGSGTLQYNTTTYSAVTGISVNTSTTGGTETKPKNYGVLYCIKT